MSSRARTASPAHRALLTAEEDDDVDSTIDEGPAAQTEGPAVAGSGGRRRLQCILLAGIFLFLASLCYVVLAEFSSVCKHRSLMQALATTQIALCDGQNAGESAAKGDVVHVACPIGVTSLPQWAPQDFGGTDGLKGAFRVHALRVERTVSMYQCVEDGRAGKNNTPAYKLGWFDYHINSSGFEAWTEPNGKDVFAAACGENFRGNPTFPKALNSTETRSASRIVAGVYDVTRHAKEVVVDTPVVMTKSWGSFYRLQHGWDGRVAAYLAPDGGSATSCPPDAPTVGCIRVSFVQSSATHLSAVGRLQAEGATGTFLVQPWQAPSSWMFSSASPHNSVDLFAEGIRSADEMINDAKTSSQRVAWLLRAAGALAATLGAHLAFVRSRMALPKSILSGGLRGTGFVGERPMVWLASIGVAVSSVSAVLAALWSVILPWFSIPLLAASVTVFGLAVHVLSRDGPEDAAEQGTPARTTIDTAKKFE